MILSAMAGGEREGYDTAAHSSQAGDYQPLKRQHRIRKVVANNAGVSASTRVREACSLRWPNGCMMSGEALRLENVGKKGKLVDDKRKQRWHW